ncbi:YlbG family protein [Limosilactobacillus sp.]|uniref:YlbG family protein n=1 Tax=Limosilactobacillus sp. TaxID=2773925 RepID=UPI0035A0FEA3
MFKLTARRALVVYIDGNRVVKTLRHFGIVRYVSRRMHYVILYVNQDQIKQLKGKINRLRAVRSVEESYRPDLDPTLTDLEMTGLYKLHDEDD